MLLRDTTRIPTRTTLTDKQELTSKAVRLACEFLKHAWLCVRSFLQANFVPHLVTLKRILAHIVQNITIRQLYSAQGGKLFRGRMQCKFGSDEFFHDISIAKLHHNVNKTGTDALS
jgi:hypothetical protein